MAFPRDPALDDTLPLLREGYEFVRSRCARLGTDGFRTRIAGRRVLCLRGPDAARFLYEGPFTRRDLAMPPSAVTLLQDFGSVQSLDGSAHEVRKATWMRMVAAEDAVADVTARFETAFAARLVPGRHALHAVAKAALCEAACGWVGALQSGRALRRRTAEMAAMIEGAGGFGPRQIKGQWLRRRGERWARRVMRPALADPASAPEGSPVRRLAEHRDVDGRKLTGKEAGVELLNVVRPTVAVARFVVFAALRLHEAPAWRDRVAADEEAAHRFVTETRRLTPFIPMIGGIATAATSFRGEAVEAGDWVLLDLFGTCRAPGAWADPDDFAPDRFAAREPTPYDLVVQGAGPYETTHRCPGERASEALTIAAVRMLARTEYAVPEQDLTVPLDRFPTAPRSGFVIEV